jgi:division protein 1
LDFSEPYGTLVSASQDDPQPRVWDLFSGTEIGRLRGHTGTVKCVQVEDHVCLTGGADGNVRLWDLRRVDADPADGWGDEGELVTLSDVAEEEEGTDAEARAAPESNGVRDGKQRATERDDCCARVLEGHTKAVTALYFEDDCLVSCPACASLFSDSRSLERLLVPPTRPSASGI